MTSKQKKKAKPKPLSDKYLKALKKSGFKTNPHKAITEIGGKSRCDYCGMEDLHDNLMQVNCTYEYAPCEKCGGFPLCSVECEMYPVKGVSYISGFGRDLK